MTDTKDKVKDRSLAPGQIAPIEIQRASTVNELPPKGTPQQESEKKAELRPESSYNLKGPLGYDWIDLEERTKEIIAE